MPDDAARKLDWLDWSSALGVLARNLRSGNTMSCGCLRADLNRLCSRRAANGLRNADSAAAL